MAEWARYSDNGYECSSHGDKRFSALFAVLPDGRTIEEAYQLDVKGYRQVTNDWREGKGKNPLNGKKKSQLFTEYVELWRQWVSINQAAFDELVEISRTKTLTDKFATSEVNQAAALCELINQFESLAKWLSFPFKM